MSISTTPEGGRRIFGKSLHGDYTITLHRDHDGPVYDAAGHELGYVRLIIKSPPEPPPPVLTPQQKQRMAARLHVCGACDQMRGFGRATVKCGRCTTCGHALNLISATSTCPLGKWSE